MSIENRLRSFISSKKATALVLQGTWGRGKTHLWRALMKEESEAFKNRRKYAYVSLFGINSLDELKVAIYQSAIELDQLNDQKENNIDGTKSNSKFDVKAKWKQFIENRKTIAKGVLIPHESHPMIRRG